MSVASGSRNRARPAAWLAATSLVVGMATVSSAVLFAPLAGATPGGGIAYEVTSAGDSGAGSGLSGDLRYVLNQVNSASTTPSTVEFDIPGGDTITLAARCPRSPTPRASPSSGRPSRARASCW